VIDWEEDDVWSHKKEFAELTEALYVPNPIEMAELLTEAMVKIRRNPRSHDPVELDKLVS
jgi:hypothetical protein